ncbi:MAG: hypothetical protein HKN46_10950 [Acidimicrobiia bacterium]|nr:hypothetical protein [Acidimicrobiia bacterium]
MRRRVMVLLAVLSTLAAGCAASQDAASVPQAIGVQGAWTIDVVNPDGTVAEHVEFHNDLTFNGQSELADFLSGDRTPGRWMIRLSTSGIAVPPPCSTTCNITEPDAAVAGAESFDLAVDRTNPQQITLRGSVDADQAGTIQRVDTFIGSCEPTVAPTSCLATSASNLDVFTRATVADVSVANGQSVQVEVVLSFGPLP